MHRHNEHSEFQATHRGVELDIVREQGAFLQEAATIMADLPSVRPADREDHTFHYPVLPLSTPYAIPEALGLKNSAIDEIEITIGDAFEASSDTPARPAYLSVDIHSGENRFTLSRSGLNGTEELEVTKLDLSGVTTKSESESDFLKRFSSAGGVSVAELNALMMSIALPNSYDDYSAYADRELQTPEAFSSLVELLRQKSIGDSASYVYNLERAGGSLFFTTENGQTTSFTLHYFDARRQTPIVVEYDVESDFRLRFVAVEDEERHVILPTADEIRFARSLLKREVITAVPEPLTQEDAENLVSEDTDYRSSNELSGYIDDTLDELGLNPPNTSA